MECLNLISRNTFIEKRIGYLGITILFSEKSEILMMATHRLRTDLQSSNRYIQAIALQTVSSIANEDICKDLGDIVGEMMVKNHAYISKKACLAGLRILKKVPEKLDFYYAQLIKLFGDRIKRTKSEHGLLISALSLAEHVIKMGGDEKRKGFLEFVPFLVIYFFYGFLG